MANHVIDKLNKKFREYSPLSTGTGKKYEYLGMTFDYMTKGKVTLSMYEYIDKMLTELPEDMNRVSKVPGAGHLFNVNPDATKFPEDKAQLFLSLVAKLLYLCRHTRQDIQTAVAFSCTRLKDPETDDYKKLTKVMQYIRNTKYLTLTIEPSTDPKWWVDSSYAVHPDMISHTGVVMSLGKGATYSASTKQKLNTKSSTEAELVAIDDAMAQVLWTRHFLVAQG